MSTPIDQFTRMRSEGSFAGSEALSVASAQELIDALAKIPVPKVEANVDCAVPKTQCLKYEAAGVKKGKEIDFWAMFVLALHAGVFVTFGAAFFTVVRSTQDPALAIFFGAQQFAAGLSFCVGLAMVILCGSELFTGNTMLIMAWCTKRITTFQWWRNLVIVYIGNFLGSVVMAALQVWAMTFWNANGNVGVQALAIAEAKCGREWGQCFCLGIMCNIMVCWSVWMTLAAREAVSKLMVFLLPITAFAAMGFEHSVANMYFLPVAMLIKCWAPPSFWATTGRKPSDYPNVSVGQCIWYNYCPSTLGNAAGAMFMLGLFYWYVYLRDDDHVSRFEFECWGIRWCASPPNRTGKRPKPEKKKKNLNKNKCWFFCPPP